jgi:chorismate--pyruvate lyase
MQKNISHLWKDWLDLQGSLTARIEELIGKKLTVKVLGDSKNQLLLEEKHFFSNQLQRARVRVVLLCDDNQPLVIARSVIPPSTEKGLNQNTLRIGNQPLGAILFKNKRMQKAAQREFLLLHKCDSLWRNLHQSYPTFSSPVWGRRTLYHLRSKPLLVTEIFLPELVHYINPSRED